jgi:hypothetical protein
MKNARFLIATALLFAAVSVYVQAQERPLLTVTIPFAFTVENSSLPAGVYTISVLSPYNMIKVQSADRRRSAMVFVTPAPKLERSEQAKVVFNRRGDLYFLAQVWEQGNNVHREVQIGNLARELAKSGETMQNATILASASNR